MRNVYKSRKALSYDKAFWFVEEEPKRNCGKKKRFLNFLMKSGLLPTKSDFIPEGDFIIEDDFTHPTGWISLKRKSDKTVYKWG